MGNFRRKWSLISILTSITIADKSNLSHGVSTLYHGDNLWPALSLAGKQKARDASIIQINEFILILRSIYIIFACDYKSTDMLRFLSILFIIIFVIPFLLRVILRFIFGNSRQQNRPSQQKNTTSSSSRTQQTPPKKKVISENEGEYVDYEEVKD